MNLRVRHFLDSAFSLNDLRGNNFRLSLFYSDFSLLYFWSSVSLFHCLVLNNRNYLLVRDVLSNCVLIDLRDPFLLDFNLVVISDLHFPWDLFVLDFFLVLCFYSGHWNVLLTDFSFDNIKGNTGKRTTDLFFGYSNRKSGCLLLIHDLGLGVGYFYFVFAVT